MRLTISVGFEALEAIDTLLNDKGMRQEKRIEITVEILLRVKSVHLEKKIPDLNSMPNEL